MSHFRDLQTSRAAKAISLRAPWPLQRVSAVLEVLCLKTRIFVLGRREGLSVAGLRNNSNKKPKQNGNKPKTKQQHIQGNQTVPEAETRRRR